MSSIPIFASFGAVGLLSSMRKRLTVFWATWFLASLCTGVSAVVGPLELRPEMVLAGLAVLLPVTSHRRARWKAKLPKSTRTSRSIAMFFTFIGAWVLWALIVSAFSPGQFGSSLTLLLWFTLSVSAISTIDRLAIPAKQLLSTATVCFSVYCGITLIAWLLAQSGGPQLFVVQNFGESNFRAVGLSLEPNLLGAASTIWLSVMYFARDYLSRSLRLMAGPIALVGMATLTRTSIIATLLLVVFIVVRHLRRPGFAMSISAVGVPFVYLFPTPGLLADDGRLRAILSLQGFDTGTGAFRARSWSIAIEEWSAQLDRQLSGFGVGSFPIRHSALVDVQQLDYLSNFWVVTLYDTGIVGLTLTVMAIFALCRATRRKMDALPLLVTITLSLTITNASWLQFMWLAVAVVIRICRDEEASGELSIANNQKIALLSGGPGGTHRAAKLIRSSSLPIRTASHGLGRSDH